MRIILIMLLLFASLSYSYKSVSQNSETSSEVEYNQEMIATDNLMVTIQNTEFNLFNKEFIQSELELPYEVLIVLKWPGLESSFYHSYVRPLIGHHNNLKELLVYSQIDKYVTMG